MTYRNDLDALAARHAALEAEVGAKTLERDVAARLLEEARARSNRPVLENIRIATPCSADWNQMTGDERVRMCAHCNKHVYNLSSMTRDEAEALIEASGANLCARYYQRADGTILLADCEVGRKQKQKRRLVAVGAAMLLAGGGVVAYKLSRPSKNERMREEPMAIAGGLQPIPVAPPPPSLEHDVMVTAGGISFDPPPAPPPKHQVPRPKHPKHGVKK